MNHKGKANFHQYGTRGYPPPGTHAEIGNTKKVLWVVCVNSFGMGIDVTSRLPPCPLDTTYNKEAPERIAPLKALKLSVFPKILNTRDDTPTISCHNSDSVGVRLPS